MAALAPATSYALSCRTIDGGLSTIEAIGTSLAVPADVADGTIIWESDKISTDIRCENDYPTSYKYEKIYLWNDPAKISSIGKGIRIGIRYNNVIYPSQGKIDTGYSIPCLWLDPKYCKGQYLDIKINFSVFVEKYGTVPDNGQASTLSQYRVFQADGEESVSTKGFNYILTGLSNIRFIPCSPNLTITPNVVNFSRAYSGSAANGKVASTAKFTLGLNKNCDTPYTVDAKFTPASGSVINELLVPPNNNSVGIMLSRVDNDETIPFSKWFKLTEMNRREPDNIDFRADLIWRADPIAGPFEASVIVDMMYK
nr:fimbrial protein [Pseudomonas sp. CVAP\